MKTSIEQNIINRIMDRAIQISGDSSETCRNFTVMTSPMRPNTLILRWLCIDTNDQKDLSNTYCYECFDLDGKPQYCSVNNLNPTEANLFFRGLTTLYEQQCAIDHKQQPNV